jgi:hypothetical protein
MRIDDMDFENDIDLIDNRSEYRAPVSGNELADKVCESADRILGQPRSSDKLLVEQLIKENRMKEQAVEKASNLIDLLTAEVSPHQHAARRQEEDPRGVRGNHHPTQNRNLPQAGGVAHRGEPTPREDTQPRKAQRIPRG